MQSDEDELLAVRRLLQETTERALRLEMERDLAVRQAKDLAEQLDLARTDLCELLVVTGLGDHARMQSPHEAFQEAIALVGSYRQLFLSSQKRVMTVYGCAGCHGDHHGVWAQVLQPSASVMHMGTAAQIECQRAYVCPREHCVVLVSDESEDTYRHG